MAKDSEIQEVFPASSNKTYSLVEIVRGPTAMVDKGPDDTVFSFPVVAILEVLLALGATAFLVVFSLLKNAPLEELANPIITTDPAKAPWYFMGLQEMLEHMHPLLSGIILPGLSVLFLVALPYLDHDPTGAGRWFTSPRGKRIAGWTALYALVVIPAFVVLSNAFPPRELLRDVLPALLTQTVIPGAIMAVLVLLPVLVLWRLNPARTNTREVVLVLFTMLFVTGVVLTLIGFLFRGPGFQLYWPWAMPSGYNPLNNL